MAEFVMGNSSRLSLGNGDRGVNAITLVVGLLAAVISYLWIYRWRQRKLLGPKGWPILGSYLEVRANMPRFHDWVTDYMKKSPTATVCAHVMGTPIIWVGRPDNLEFMLKTNFANFPKGPVTYERLSTFLGNGIFVADGEVWKQHRKIASFEFSSRKLRDFSTDAYRQHALRLVDFLDGAATAQQAVDFQDLAMRMTMDSICKIGFGVDYGSLSPKFPDVGFARSFDNATVLTQNRQFGLAWKILRMLDAGSEKQLRQEVERLDKFTYGVIAERRTKLLALAGVGKTLEMHDLLSRFMTAEDEGGKPLSDSVLRDAILNFVIAGRDTSAVTLSWFVYRLCCHSDVAEKCYLEALANAGSAAESVEQFAELLTYDSLGKFNYLIAALTETLRLHPAVPKDGKYALNDMVLPDGTCVKKGSTVIFHPYAMGRLESLWGPDAEEFRPERWLKDGVFHPESPFKFPAFQAGPRVCLGKDAAYLQMKMTAALLVRFFRFQLVPDHPVQYRVSLVLTLHHGLKVTVSHRAPAS